MKKQSLLFLGIFILFLSCNRKIDQLDIKKYEDKFKFNNLESFDARNIPPDLNEIEDKGLLSNLWEGKDRFIKTNNYYFSLQDSPKGNQEFAVVLGDIENKNDAKQIWYFVYNSEGKQLARFIIAEYDAVSDNYAQGNVKSDGAYEVSYYQKDKLFSNKLYTVDEKGNLKEASTEKDKIETFGIPQGVPQEYFSKDVFVQRTMVFAGLDFTRTKFVGNDLEDVAEIKDKYFREWNDVLNEEKQKFNISGFFHKSNVIYDFASSFSRNEWRSTRNMHSNYQAPTFSRSSIQNLLYNVSLNSKHGIGLILIVESFDKDRGTASVWVTLFDLASKKILIADRMSGAPGGNGMRNYWINAIYDILVQVDRGRYQSWEKTY